MASRMEKDGPFIDRELHNMQISERVKNNSSPLSQKGEADKRSGVWRKTPFWQEVRDHLRRIFVLFFSTFIGRVWLYILIGLLNRFIFRRAIKNVFLLYPANDKYTLKYAYLWHARYYQWFPGLIGIMRQNGSWGLYLAISAAEETLAKDAGRNLRILVERMERIRNLVGAEQKSFAGIIPGLLRARGIVKEPVEREITATAVHRAIGQVKQIEKMPDDAALVVIGGQGFIGSRVVEYMRNDGFAGPIHSVDLKDDMDFEQLVLTLKGRPTILLNVSKKGALAKYIPYLWPEVIVLNEVYPEPPLTEVAAIQEKGARCYHISGVEARAWPPFPRAYKGGIPCCASFLPGDAEGAYRVLVTKM